MVKTSIKHCTKILIYRMLENSKDILFKVRDRERENEGGREKKEKKEIKEGGEEEESL